MRDGRAGLKLALAGALAIALGVDGPAHGQEWVYEGSTTSGPSLDD